MERFPSTGVLATTRFVVENARYVTIDFDRVDAVADDFARSRLATPTFDCQLHLCGSDPAVANYVLVLDALNFSFWAQPGQPRWRVAFQGEVYNGYWALAAALKRALADGVPLTDASYLARIPEHEVALILRGEPEAGRIPTIPLFDARVRGLREVGTVLLNAFSGQFVNAIAATRGNAVDLTLLLAQFFPSFNDVTTYEGEPVRFFKRAQICCSDLFGATGGQDWGNLTNLDQLTAFADYKVPQVLRGLGILQYTRSLAETIEQRIEIPPGSAAEVEIRAGTVWGIEYLRQVLVRHGIAPRAFELDWYIWQLGQQLPPSTPPYHLTRTIFY